MATIDEIWRRATDADTARSATRSAAAQQVGELAQRRAAIAEQLSDIERELGDVLSAASDVLDIDELARFTDVPTADLTRWLDGRKTTRTKRKRPAAGASDAKTDTSQGPPAAKSPMPDQTSTLPEPAVPRDGPAGAPVRVPAEVP